MSIHNDLATVALVQTGTGLALARYPISLLPHTEYNIPVKGSKRNTGEIVLLEPAPTVYILHIMYGLHIMTAKCLVKSKKV